MAFHAIGCQQRLYIASEPQVQLRRELVRAVLLRPTPYRWISKSTLSPFPTRQNQPHKQRRRRHAYQKPQNEFGRARNHSDAGLYGKNTGSALAFPSP